MRILSLYFILILRVFRHLIVLHPSFSLEKCRSIIIGTLIICNIITVSRVLIALISINVVYFIVWIFHFTIWRSIFPNQTLWRTLILPEILVFWRTIFDDLIHNWSLSLWRLLAYFINFVMIWRVIGFILILLSKQIILPFRFVNIFWLDKILIGLLNNIISIWTIVFINYLNFSIFCDSLKSVGTYRFRFNFLFHVYGNVFLRKCFLLFLLVWCHF